MAFLTFLLSNLTATAAIGIVVILAISLVLFRPNIKSAIDRLNAQPPTVLGSETAPAQGETPKPQNFINLQPDNAEARDRAAELTAILGNSSHTAEQKLTLALTDLANKDLRLEYEVVFRNIYGSQFEALRALRQEGPQPLAKFHQSFLDRVAIAYPELPSSHKTDFETWVGFLTIGAHPLISLDGGIAAITRTGSGFLAYVASFSSSQRPSRGL